MYNRALNKRALGVIIAIGLIFIVHTSLATPKPTVSASTSFEATQESNIYLPLILQQCNGKCWSGVHVGNRNLGDWYAPLLSRIDPQSGGEWPSVVVAISNQVYNINRYPSNDPNNPCRIYSAGVRSPILFDYIKRASQAGVRVVIRLLPSPGNFEDWNNPNWPNHRLSSGPPVGPDGYCGYTQYRSKGDLGDEMGRIQELNWSQGFLVFGFEPANEPNVEWYSSEVGAPRIWESTAWLDMDVYFSALYDYVVTNYPAYIRVLTPPMSQSKYAEGNDIEDVGDKTPCEDVWLVDGQYKGYDLMQETIENKSHGINWHNYWSLGKELYNACPYGQHVSYYFSFWMREIIRNQEKPVTISEADVGSPWQMRGLNPLPNKRAYPNDIQAADSIRHFFYSEYLFGGLSHYGVKPRIASWLLGDDTGNEEHDWHKAYEESGFEYYWYAYWYSGDEE